MALHWRPVGRLPAGVYWRRRALVLGALLAVLLLVLVLLRALTADAGTQRLAQEPEARPTATPRVLPSTGTVGPSIAPTRPPSPFDGVSDAPRDAAPCTDGLLRVQADAAPTRVAVGAPAELRLAVTNTGPAPCSRPLGPGALELLVYSGRDRIWSSDDCAPGGASGPRVLAAGERVLQTVRWPGRRSRPGCGGPIVPARPGTYRVVARVGALTQQGAVFRVV